METEQKNPNNFCVLFCTSYGPTILARVIKKYRIISRLPILVKYRKEIRKAKRLYLENLK